MVAEAVLGCGRGPNTRRRRRCRRHHGSRHLVLGRSLVCQRWRVVKPDVGRRSMKRMRRGVWGKLSSQPSLFTGRFMLPAALWTPGCSCLVSMCLMCRKLRDGDGLPLWIAVTLRSCSLLVRRTTLCSYGCLETHETQHEMANKAVRDELRDISRGIVNRMKEVRS